MAKKATTKCAEPKEKKVEAKKPEGIVDKIKKLFCKGK